MLLSNEAHLSRLMRFVLLSTAYVFDRIVKSAKKGAAKRSIYLVGIMLISMHLCGFYVSWGVIESEKCGKEWVLVKLIRIYSHKFFIISGFLVINYKF